jgi:hypothetical protein
MPDHAELVQLKRPLLSSERPGPSSVKSDADLKQTKAALFSHCSKQDDALSLPEQGLLRRDHVSALPSVQDDLHTPRLSAMPPQRFFIGPHLGLPQRDRTPADATLLGRLKVKVSGATPNKQADLHAGIGESFEIGSQERGVYLRSKAKPSDVLQELHLDEAPKHIQNLVTEEPLPIVADASLHESPSDIDTTLQGHTGVRFEDGTKPLKGDLAPASPDLVLSRPANPETMQLASIADDGVAIRRDCTFCLPAGQLSDYVSRCSGQSWILQVESLADTLSRVTLTEVSGILFALGRTSSCLASWPIGLLRGRLARL